jgi:hypothetical protein
MIHKKFKGKGNVYALPFYPMTLTWKIYEEFQPNRTIGRSRSSSNVDYCLSIA